MQYRTIKKTGEKLSVLGYGCMRMPTKLGKIEVDRAVAQIRQAIDGGVNYLDTAWVYHMGASEGFLGEHVLKDGYREKVNVATKLPCFLINKASQFEDYFEKQRKRLKLDVIDYYLLHSLDGACFRKMLKLGIIDFMDKLKKEGKIRFMGFSFHGLYEEFEEIVDAYDWDFCQVQYNILDEHYQAGIKGIEYAAAKDLGVFIMEPLRGGSLANVPEKAEKIYDEAETKRTPVDWALRWIYNRPEVTMILSGMNDEAHIDENLEIASTSYPNSMSEEELELVNRVRDAYNSLMVVGCTSCQYCMPCPAGIDIPNAFKCLNNKKMFPSRLNSVMYLKSIIMQSSKKPISFTTACMDCGKCEKACPQHIDIRNMLKLVHKEMEGPFSRMAVKIARNYANK